MDEETKSHLDILVIAVQSFTAQLKEDNDPISNAGPIQFDETDFIRHLAALADTISHECTKFSMIFTDEAIPTAKASESLSNRLIGMSAALFKATVSLPRDGIGKYFRQSIMDAVIDVFQSIVNLGKAAKERHGNSKAQLQETGTVWEACDRLKAVPKNSRELLLRTITAALSMVDDAFSEIQEISEEANVTGTENSSEVGLAFTPADMNRLHACSQLVKAAKAVLTKTRGAIEESPVDQKSASAADDELTARVQRVSPLVDNVVSSFHEDELEVESLTDEVTKLHDVIKELLNAFRKSPYYQEAHSKWLAIFCTAVQHNLTKYCTSSESTSK